MSARRVWELPAAFLASCPLDSETTHVHSFAGRPGVSNHPGVSSCLALSLYQAGTSSTVSFNPAHAQFIVSPEPGGSV